MTDPAPPYSRSLRVTCWLVFAAGLAVNLLVWAYPRGGEIGNGHAFRQFQTALTTRYLVRDGFRLDYETPVLGPPWSIPMEFPIYQYAVAAVVRLTGAPLEPAGRIVSMGFFWTALPAVWLLLGLWGVARETRLLALALLLTCPVYLFYGRHFMIETTALCLGLWFLWATARAIRSGSVPAGLLATGLGAAAGLAKITTFFGFGVAAALFVANEIRARPREWGRMLGRAGCILLPGLVLSYLWVRHADQLKAENPLGSFLVSSTLREFNFAHAGERLDPGVWWKIHGVTTARVTGGIALTLALIGLALTTRPQRWLAGACALCYVAALALFTNLFYVHDYYFEATAVFLVVAVALGLEGLLTSGLIPAALRSLLVALVFLAQLTAFWREFGGALTSPPPGRPLVAPLLERLTDPDEVIAVVGQDWNPRLPYYCDRRAIMVPAGLEQNRAAVRKSVSLLGSRRVGALVVTGDFCGHPHIIIPLTRILGVTLRAIVEGDGTQVYLRTDRLGEIPARLAGREFPGFKINRDYDPAKDVLNNENETDLTQAPWRDKFPMATPAPERMSGTFPLNLADLNGTQVIATHAPNSIYFQPPAGARRLQAVGGMFPGSYQGQEYTDGVVIEAWEVLPDGNQQLHFQRTLHPHERPEDRAEFTIDIALDRPFLGPVYLRVDPGPDGRINYDWVYWRSVQIH